MARLCGRRDSEDLMEQPLALRVESSTSDHEPSASYLQQKAGNGSLHVGLLSIGKWLQNDLSHIAQVHSIPEY